MVPRLRRARHQDGDAARAPLALPPRRDDRVRDPPLRIRREHRRVRQAPLAPGVAVRSRAQPWFRDPTPSLPYAPPPGFLVSFCEEPLLIDESVPGHLYASDVAKARELGYENAEPFPHTLHLTKEET